MNSIKKHLKLVGATLVAAGLIVAGGLVFPLHSTKADEQHTLSPCPAGTNVYMDYGAGTTTCGDGTPANTTPDTPAPASTTAPAQTSSADSTGVTAPNCH